MEQLANSINISTATIAIDYGLIKEAIVHSSGYLDITFTNGQRQQINLSKPRHRESMIAVVNDVILKFRTLTHKIVEKPLCKTNITQTIANITPQTSPTRSVLPNLSRK